VRGEDEQTLREEDEQDVLREEDEQDPFRHPLFFLHQRLTTTDPEKTLGRNIRQTFHI
jgi:hypothetical protein